MSDCIVQSSQQQQQQQYQQQLQQLTLSRLSPQQMQQLHALPVEQRAMQFGSYMRETQLQWQQQQHMQQQVGCAICRSCRQDVVEPLALPHAGMWMTDALAVDIITTCNA